jgi:hypothetical protein
MPTCRSASANALRALRVSLKSFASSTLGIEP